ncbi:hypothetical protein [Sphingomonas tagetis]|nr:hypothetical protein [Sphingomonas tagetis]
MFVLTLSGCGRPEPTAVEKAERRYTEARKTGTKEDQCREGRRLLEAWTEAGETRNVPMWKNNIDITCGALEIERATRVR